MKTKKITSIFVVLVMSIIAFVAIFNSNKKDIDISQISNFTNSIPIKFDEIPVDIKIGNGKKELEVKYTNSSGYDISNLRLEVKLKDTDEIIELECSEPVKIGKESVKFKGKAPKSGKVEDIEILKYKISLSKGVYMEYDVQLNQYNWS